MTVNIKNTKLYDSEFLNEQRSFLSDKYIIEPIKNNIGSKKINVIYAPTGFGKTFSMWMKLAPWWFNEGGGQLFILVSPFLETLDEEEIEDYIQESMLKEGIFPKTYFNGGKYSMSDVDYALSRGKKVIMTFSDKTLVNKLNDKQFTNLLGKYGNKTMTVRDEISYGMTSDITNAQKNTGWRYQFYKAAYFKNFVKLLKLGSEVFGLTATPTREQLNDLKSVKAEYQIINDMPEKDEMVMYQKWWNSVLPTDYTPEDFDDITLLKKEVMLGMDSLSVKERKIVNLFDEADYEDNNTKLTMMISLQSAGKNPNRFTIERFFDMLNEFPDDFGKRYEDKTFIVTTSELGWKEYDFFGNETGKGEKKGDGWLREMKNPKTPSRLLIVLQKGQYGINIPTLSYGVSFRDSKSDTGDTGETVRTSSKQFLGRFIRTNMGDTEWMLFDRLVKDFGIERGREYLQLKNTFDFRAVDGPKNFWRDSLEEYKEYGNSWDEFSGFFFQTK